MAIDLGTTTVVLEVVHMESGEVVYQASFGNPQRFGGSDVMHRISYDGGPFRGELHKAAVAAVNRVLKDACRTLGMDRHEIQEMMVAGNSTMRDLFFGLDVKALGRLPFKSTGEVTLDNLLRQLPGLVRRRRQPHREANLKADGGDAR
ncbi:MAG: ATP-binding protein, partial [Aquincola sp.]|nr:ATP-binding protein [Aquincola sp.]